MSQRHGLYPSILPDFGPRFPARNGARIMLYSHDTFGLGHLRRSRALAQAITATDPSASALILTGSPIAGRFDFPPRVDHIRLPGVCKQSDGSYVSQTLGMSIEEVTDLRASVIRVAAEKFAPDVLIVDKEPTGFRGEMLPTLGDLTARGQTRIVLGLRDVLDDPETLAREWERKGAVAATERFYDEIWAYGLKSVYDPTAGLSLTPETRARMIWTGYLRRTASRTATPPEAPYILVTAGGGGDGEAMVDLVLSAYERDPDLGPRAILVYGPFLSGERRARFEARVAALKGRVHAVGFDANIETLYAGAEGVICMGGYNTFCEVISFDKRAVIVPRTVPRLEQWIRAARAEELGLARMLDEKRDGLTPDAMIAAIHGLPAQPSPSAAMQPGLLAGLETVTARIAALTGRATEHAAE